MTRPIAEKRLLVLTALDIEAKPLRSILPPGVDIYVIGMRAVRLQNAPQGYPRILLAGMSGALDPSLRPGDVLMEQGDEKIFLTSHEVISSPTDKHVLFLETKRRAVDMETDLVRNWANQQGSHFVAIRSISDAANEVLDPVFAEIIDEVGNPIPHKLFLSVLLHPSSLPRMIHMGFRSRHVLLSLKDKVAQFIADI